MNKLKNTLKNIWNDESGQGATEYILLVVIVVAVVALFGGEIKSIIGGKIEQISGQMNSDVFSGK